MYYFDTSSLRRAGQVLSAPGIAKESSCSALTIIELLHGILRDEKEFSIRVTAIRRAMESGMSINWAFPDEVIIGAFDELELQGADERLACLQQIAREATASKGPSDLRERLDALDLAYPLSFFDTYDDEFDINWIRTTVSGARDIRAAFEEQKLNPGCDLPSEMFAGSNGDFCRMLSERPDRLNDSLVLFSIATLVAMECFGTPTDEQVNEVYSSYNWSIELYVRALAQSNASSWAHMATPKKNDGMDISQFLYLGTGVVLVTEDSKLTELAKLIGVPVLTTSDLGKQ